MSTIWGYIRGKFVPEPPVPRLFGRPIRQPDVKAVDPEPDVVRPDPWAAAAQRLREEGIGREPEPAHPDVVVLRVVPAPEPEANVYRPVCSHEGLNEWDAIPNLTQVGVSPSPMDYYEEMSSRLEILRAEPDRFAEYRFWRFCERIGQGKTWPRDSRTGRFLPANRFPEGETR